MTVVEYYNKTLDAYFMTGRTPEQSALDGVADFQRTGMTFQATATAAATLHRRASAVSTSPTPVRLPVRILRSAGRGLRVHPRPEHSRFLVGRLRLRHAATTSSVCPGGTTPIYRDSARRPAARPRIIATAPARRRMTPPLRLAMWVRVAFCVTAATAATAAPTPSGDACGTFYFPGKQISYQTTSTGAASSTSTFVRTYDPTPVSFNGQTATRIVDTPSTGSPSYTMISDGATSWSELGGRSTGSSGTQETYFSPPIVFPKTMTVGQSISVNRTVTFNPATPTGNGTQTGTIVLTSRESVTAPAGTYANACKYTINTTTTYPIGSTSNTARLPGWRQPWVWCAVKSRIVRPYLALR